MILLLNVDTFYRVAVDTFYQQNAVEARCIVEERVIVENIQFGK